MAPPSASRSSPSNPPRFSSFKNLYLILYNLICALLWLIVLGRVVSLVSLTGFESTYAGVGEFAKWTQTIALLEVVHAAAGVVRAPILTTGMQVASRLLLVWPVIDVFPALATSPAYSSMLVAWSVTEVVRYSYFVLNLSGYQPALVTWLRYNTFYVLYPTGISSECYLIYKAIEPARALRQEFAWALQAILLIYVPGSYILFTHMMAQRRKVMRGKGKQVQKSA